MSDDFISVISYSVECKLPCIVTKSIRVHRNTSHIAVDHQQNRNISTTTKFRPKAEDMLNAG